MSSRRSVRELTNLFENLSVEGSSGTSSDESDKEETTDHDRYKALDDLFDDDDFAVLVDESVMEELTSEPFGEEIVEDMTFEWDPAQINDTLSFLIPDANSVPYVRIVREPHDMTAFNRQAHNKHTLYQALSRKLSLIGVKGEAYITNGPQSLKVGFVKDPDRVFSIDIEQFDFLATTQSLSENASTKATCLGYSLLVHSLACVIISGHEGMIEPIEGWDVIRQHVSFEVTGDNYLNRQSSADCIINKYLLISSVMPMESMLVTMLEYAHGEDICDNSIFEGGGLDQPDSPYTEYATCMNNAVMSYPLYFFESLGKQMTSWFSRQKPSKGQTYDIIDHSQAIDQVIFKYSKNIDGRQCLPSPFRVIGGKPLETSIAINLTIRPVTSAINVGTHFHTLMTSDDVEQMMFERTPNYTKAVDYPDDKLMTWVSNTLSQHDIYRTICIEAELLSKINGREGCFYSEYSNCGIAWRKRKAGSLTYYACYYQVGEPPRKCGKWRLIDSEIDLWQSASFKTSISDINFARILPARINTMIVSCIAYTNKRTRKFVITKFLMMIGFIKWSTWQTSAIFGDMRFLTLCAVSNSGDVSGMILKAIGRVKKFINFPDYYCLILLKRLSATYKGQKYETTPIYGMPMRFLGIEKDFALFTMWHIRGEAHATECFLKLRDGVIQEKETRKQVIEHLTRQCELIRRAPDFGITQQEFDQIMDNTPNVPFFNFLMFSGLCYLSADNLNAGKRQAPTKNKLSQLVSDHHSTICSNPSKPHEGIITATRVADGYSKLLSDYGDPQGIHELLIRMNIGPKLRSIFLIHPKDSKSKNREIPQMTNYMRVPQFVSETLLSIYTDEEDADMMQNPEKFSIYAQQFSSVMRQNGLTRSEDKSFFCGHMHPEFMAVATCILAKVLGSTSIVLASALIRCDKSRVTVTPIGMDESKISMLEVDHKYRIKSGKKLVERSGVINLVHMQQGVRAMAAACINTIFTTGLDVIQKRVAPDIKETEIDTTSDDATRGVVPIANPICNSAEVLNDYIEAPVQLMPQIMMLDSTDKAIKSSRLSEFNNVICGPNGLFPQHFAHSHLVIQPLNGENIIDDIYEIISRARSSLSWGDSFDTARAAFSNYIVLLMQKWLITTEEIDKLFELGLFPNTDAQLLRGGGELDFNLKLCMLRSMSDEIRSDVNLGYTKLHSGLRKFNVKKKDSPDRYMKVITTSSVFSIQRAYAKINAARRLKGRLKPDFIQPYNFKRMQKTKDEFFEAISTLQAPATDEEKELLASIPALPDVVIIPREPTRRSFMPCSQGGKTIITELCDTRIVIAKRICGLNVNRHLNDYEQDKVALTDEQFTKWLNMRDLVNDNYGIKFKSPTGRPLFRFHDDIVFSRPQSFTFDILLPRPIDQKPVWTHGGQEYKTFLPVWWGGGNIQSSIDKRTILAFGYARVGSDVAVFYKLPKSSVKMTLVPNVSVNEKFLTIRTKQMVISCPLARDWSPINFNLVPRSASATYPLGLRGDTTALMNYGNYLNTSARTANIWMKEIFNKHGSDFPPQLVNFKPSYPHFRPDSTKFNRAIEVNLIGTNFVTSLELLYDKNPKITLSIDVNSRPPKEIIVKREDVESQYD